MASFGAEHEGHGSRCGRSRKFRSAGCRYATETGGDSVVGSAGRGGDPGSRASVRFAGAVTRATLRTLLGPEYVFSCPAPLTVGLAMELGDQGRSRVSVMAPAIAAIDGWSVSFGLDGSKPRGMGVRPESMAMCPCECSL